VILYILSAAGPKGPSLWISVASCRRSARTIKYSSNAYIFSIAATCAELLGISIDGRKKESGGAFRWDWARSTNLSSNYHVSEAAILGLGFGMHFNRLLPTCRDIQGLTSARMSFALTLWTLLAFSQTYVPFGFALSWFASQFLEGKS